VQAETLTRAVRIAAVGAGLVLLLAIVAAAARSGFGNGGSSHGTVSHTLVSYAMTTFLIVFFCLIPVVLYMRIAQMRENPEQRSSSLRRNLRAFAGIAGAMVFAFVFAKVWPHIHLQRHVPPKLASPPVLGRGNLKVGHATTAATPTFEWPVLWAAFAIAVAAAGLMVYRIRSRPPVPAPETLEQELAASIGDAIDDLESEPDARRAVIAAYARMEAVLGRHGLRRRISETPIEYLQRVLNDLTAQGDAVSRLTALFERAKFSTHAIGDEAKHEAITSLREIREGIA
jgi:membrane protein implicated in regulation of membrane protease activity